MAASSLPRRARGTGAPAAVTALLTMAAAVLLALSAAPPAAAQTDPPSLPRPGDLTLGGRTETVLIGLTIRAGAPGSADVVVHVEPLSAPDAERLDVQLVVNDVTVPLHKCAPHCRRGVTDLTGGEVVTVTVAGEDGGTAQFRLPDLPAPPGGQLLEKATREMRDLESYRIVEQLSPPEPALRSRYAVQAPDRLRFRMENGQHTVRIGEYLFTRRDPDDDWEIRSAPRLEVPNHIWDLPGPVAVRRIAREIIDGVPTDVISFMIQAGDRPIWYRLWVDEAGLVPRAQMRTRGHFMDHTYYAFNEPVTIRAPVSRLTIVRHELLAERPLPHGVAVLTRAGLYGGTLVAAGGVAFLGLLAAAGVPGRAQVARRVVSGAAVGLAAALTVVPLEVVIAGGDGVAGLAMPDLWQQVVASGVGERTALAAAGFTVLLLGVARWTTSGSLRVATGGALAVVAAQLVTGHSTVVNPVWVGLTANFSHLLAAAVWVGGLALLPLVLREPLSPAGATTVTRFSSAAAAAVGVFAAAGAILAFHHAGGALSGTPYGWTLLTKAALVTATVAIAAYNHWRLVPAIRRGDAAAWARLRHTVRAEAVGVAAVLVVTAGLVALPLPAG